MKCHEPKLLIILNNNYGIKLIIKKRVLSTKQNILNITLNPTIKRLKGIFISKSKVNK